MAKNRKQDRKRTADTPNRPDPTAPGSGSRSNLPFYLVLGLVAAAGIAWLLLAAGGGAPDVRPIGVADMEADASGGAGVSMGPADAPVTVIEFEDFRCPSCRQFNWQRGRPLRQNLATGDDAVLRWVVYDFPIFGQASWYPMIAARCAEDQGRFWDMHDLLFARTEAWYGESNPNGAFIDLAGEIGLDVDAFRQCLDDRPHLQDIAASRKYGESLGVAATPTLYLNGRPLDMRRYGSYEALEELILETARRAETAGGEAEQGPGGEAVAGDASG